MMKITDSSEETHTLGVAPSTRAGMAQLGAPTLSCSLVACIRLRIPFLLYFVIILKT